MEIERRLSEYDSGAIQAVDAEDVFAKARFISSTGPSKHEVLIVAVATHHKRPNYWASRVA